MLKWLRDPVGPAPRQISAGAIMPDQTTAPGVLVKPGAALKKLRAERGWTLAELSQKTGFPLSTLSKIENGKMEVTIDKLLRIAVAFEVNIADLFGTPTNQYASGETSRRRSITRAGDGRTVDAANGRYAYQAHDLLNKSLTPIIAEIHARSLEEFGSFHRHSGEEYVFVIEGELALYSDTYTPAYLSAGDSIYFDSDMGHAYVNVGSGRCQVLSICSDPGH
jgi:transcriptional regulator with XRE-family HTH domain